MPTLKEMASTTLEGVASAAINYGVSSAIAPFVGPLGAAVAPRLFTAAAATTIATSATAAVITKGIITCVKATATHQTETHSNNTEKPLNEEFDDVDVPLPSKP